jgi:putative ABC transport system permease protein
MGTLTKIAFRNLNRQKKRSFLLGGAIAFGVFVVTMINGFAGSFQSNVAANMAQLFAGHVFIEGVEKNAKGTPFSIIHDDKPIVEALKEIGIPESSIARRSVAGGTLVFEGKKMRQTIYGADLEKETLLRKRLELKQGSWDKINDPHALVLSEGVAKKLKIEVGDRVLVELKTATGQNNLGEFILEGISTDMGIFSSMVAYAHIAYINELLNIAPGEYQQIGVFIPNLEKAESTATKLSSAMAKRDPVFVLPPAKPGDTTQLTQSRYQRLVKLAKSDTWTGTKYRIFTINDTISQIDSMVQAINMISLIILIILFLIIMVGINNTFRMIMYERVKEIGTMRALGLQRNKTRNMFLLEAVFLSVGGTVAGWVFAGVVMFFLSLINFGTGTVLAFFMKNGHLAFAVPPLQALGNFLLILALTVLAALPPARAAARLEPAQALRNTK